MAVSGFILSHLETLKYGIICIHRGGNIEFPKKKIEKIFLKFRERVFPSFE